MPKITYIHHDGSQETLDVNVGQSVMQASVQAGLMGIVAECGGSCSCGTCHVHVDDSWFDRLEPATPDEADLLGFVIDPRPNSRLACQVIVSEELDGLIVYTPEPGNQ